jgi:hypothetical protein
MLTIPVNRGHGNKFSIRALVDTGAEVNIIKRGIMPQEYFEKG